MFDRLFGLVYRFLAPSGCVDREDRRTVETFGLFSIHWRGMTVRRREVPRAENMPSPPVTLEGRERVVEAKMLSPR